MDLSTGKYYWSSNVIEEKAYTSFEQDDHCQIAIVGGGITAAIMAYKLTRAGYECIVLDKNQIAHGSTIASTSISRKLSLIGVITVSA